MQILRLLGYLMPAFLEVTVPMAMLLAILIAFGRLSADAEMIAMRSSGLSIYQLVPPVVLFVVHRHLPDGRPVDVRAAVGQPQPEARAVGHRPHARDRRASSRRSSTTSSRVSSSTPSRSTAAPIGSCTC